MAKAKSKSTGKKPAAKKASVAESAPSNEMAKSDIPEETEAQPVEQTPNVIWRGEKEPSQSVRIGMDTLNLPNAETQRKGFYSEHARRLVLGIPGYKYLKPKGEK